MSSSSKEYQDKFFDYINAGSTSSASVVCPLIINWLNPASVLDVGCGVGAWCKEWQKAGANDVVGVDGDYVERSSLLIGEDSFFARDLASGFTLGRKFDLVTSLEVAEHLPESSAADFIANLTKHGDRVLFSAAVPGQGGQHHINEQPLSYWREHFARSGFRCFDPLRPLVASNQKVEPWYRYNALLYVKDDEVASLPETVRAAELSPDAPIPDLSPLRWRVRNGIIRRLPRSAVAQLTKVKHAWFRRARKR